MRLALGGGRARIVRAAADRGRRPLAARWAGRPAARLLGHHVLVATLLPLSPVPLAFDSRPDVRVMVATLGFCRVQHRASSASARRGALARPTSWCRAEGAGGRGPGRGRGSAPANLLVATQIALSLGLLTTAGLFIARGDEGRGRRSGLPSRSASCSRRSTRPSRATTRRRAATGLPAPARSRPVDARRAVRQLRVDRGVRGTDGRQDRAEGAARRPAPARTAVAGRHERDVVHRGIGLLRRRSALPVVRGRSFTLGRGAGRQSAPPVAIIDEPLAEALFRSENPVGQQIQIADARRRDARSGTGWS